MGKGAKGAKEAKGVKGGQGFSMVFKEVKGGHGRKAWRCKEGNICQR